MLLEGVGGGVGGAKHLYIEALEQSPWAEFGSRQPVLQVVVDSLGALSVQLLLYAEDADQLVGQPKTGGSSTEQVEIIGEALPDTPVDGLDWRADRKSVV